jgi:YD repeat-containing protein
MGLPTGHILACRGGASGIRSNHVFVCGGRARERDVQTDAKNQLLAFEYDRNSRVKKVTAGGEVTTIAYEPGSDNRQHVVAGPADITYGYDAAGRLTAVRTVIGGELFDTRFEFDKNDNAREIVYPSRRRVRIDVDTVNRVTQVRDVLSGAVYASNFTYHPSGAVASYVAGNGIVHQFAYDPVRRWPTEIQAGPLSLTYTNYDAVGNVGTIVDGRGTTFNQTFSYDLLDRLTQSDGAYGQVPYTYDQHGNMKTHGTETMSYDSATLRLTTRSGQALSYDANGNMTGGLQGTYTYNAFNQMRTATVGASTTSYDYDADQWRVRKVAGSTTTYYLRDPNGRVLSEMTVDGTNARKFRDYIYAGSRLLAVVEQ